MDHQVFLNALRASPDDHMLRLVYADWLEDQGDERAAFLRVQAKLRPLAPDHPKRSTLEAELSRWRKGCDQDWLNVVEPERDFPAERYKRFNCNCFRAAYEKQAWPRMEFHREPQDTRCSGWIHLCQLIEEAAADGRTEFAPFAELSAFERAQIVTLPPSIAKLKAVRRLDVCGSNLVRIPVEIAELTNLEVFETYMSYRLHWVPYEITHCGNLRQSSYSTRALYGNYKYRPPFPLLGEEASPRDEERVERSCSVCGTRFVDHEAYRVWISLRVATDVVPLLVNACSPACIDRLPTPTDAYVQQPHRGGLQLVQPPAR